jgi:hypothetical protein
MANRNPAAPKPARRGRLRRASYARAPVERSPRHRPQWLTTGGQDPQARQRRRQRIYRPIEEVLAVVEHQQKIALGQPADERILVRKSPDLGSPSAAATSAPTSSADRSEPSHTTVPHRESCPGWPPPRSWPKPFCPRRPRPSESSPPTTAPSRPPRRSPAPAPAAAGDAATTDAACPPVRSRPVALP